MADSEVRFYAVEEGGPRLLETNIDGRRGMEVYDRLELGAYSRLRSYPGVRFLGLQEHLERTDLSQRLMGLPHPLDHARLRRSMQSTVEDYPGESTFCRFDLLAAPARGFGCESFVLLSVAPFVPVPSSYKEEGVGAVFSDLVRENPLAKRAAFVRERGGYALGGQEAYERLLLGPDGSLLEGSSSNFFGIVRGQLRATQEGALQGVTQRFCLRLARELGLGVEERAVHVDDIPDLDEAFLTSSSRGVVPIVTIEGQAVGTGRPGPWTRKLLRGYDELAEREARPAWPLS